MGCNFVYECMRIKGEEWWESNLFPCIQKNKGVLEFYQNQFSAICVTVVDKLSLSKLTQGFPHISGAPAGRYN